MRLALPVIIFVATRLAILWTVPPICSDSKMYCDYAVRGIDLREVAYVDFGVEYPPGSYWAMCLPRLISSKGYSANEFREDAVLQIFPEYRFFYRTEMCLADGVAFCFFLLLVGNLRPDLLAISAWGYVLTGALLAPVLYDRLDAVLLMLLMIWGYAAARANSSANAIIWDLLAGAALGLAIGFKWAPIVMTPYYLLGIWAANHGWTRAIVGGAALAVCTALPFLAHLPSTGMSVLRFLEYHSGRAIEVESLYATALMAPMIVSREFDVQSVLGSGSWEVAGAWSATLGQLSLGVLLVGYGALFIVGWLRRHEFAQGKTIFLAAFVLVFTVTFSKVLSPQYFIWLLPLMLLVGVGCFSYRQYTWFAFLLILVAGLTTWIFPFHFLQVKHAATGVILPRNALLQGLGDVREIHGPMAAVLAVRNVLLLGLTIWLGLGLVKTPRRFEAPHPWASHQG